MIDKLTDEQLLQLLDQNDSSQNKTFMPANEQERNAKIAEVFSPELVESENPFSNMSDEELKSALSAEMSVKPTEREIMKKTADTSIPRTIIDQLGQNIPFGDEISSILGREVFAYPALAYHNIMPEALGGSAPGAELSTSDLPPLSDTMAMGNERIQAQFDERPALSLAAGVIPSLMFGVGATGLTGKGERAASTLSKVPGLAPAIDNAAKFTGVSRAAPAISKTAANLDDWIRSGSKIGQALKATAVGVPTMGLYGLGDDTDEGRLENAAWSAPFGAIPLAGYGAASAYRGGKNAVKGASELIAPKIEQHVAEMALNAMDKYRIPLTRSQLGSSAKNKMLASVAEKMPFSGGEAIYDSQQKAFNRAIAKSFGVDSDTITGKTIKEGYKATGELFDQALEGLSVKVDDDAIINPLSRLQNETQFVSNDQAKIVNKYIDKFLEQANEKGFVPAEKLGSFRSDLTKAIQRTSGDAKNYLKDLREIVMDASVAGDEERRKLLNEARMKYKNLKTVEDIATKAQGNSGNISPSLLMNPTKKSFSGTMSRGGESDLEELARIGQQFLRHQPTSTTAERLQITGQLGLPLGMILNPSVAPILAAPSIGSAAFNAINRNQNLVRKAAEKAANSNLKTIGAKSPLEEIVKQKKAIIP